MLLCLSSVSLCRFFCLSLCADMEKAFGWLAANRGACLDAEYPYTARVGTCNSACRRVLKVNGYTAVAANSEAAFVVSGSDLKSQLSAGASLQLSQLRGHHCSCRSCQITAQESRSLHVATPLGVQSAGTFKLRRCSTKLRPVPA